jgi:hypothetical protein
MITIQITEEQRETLVRALEYYQEDLQLDDFPIVELYLL